MSLAKPDTSRCMFNPTPGQAASGRFPPAAVSFPSGRATARNFFIAPWTARSWWLHIPLLAILSVPTSPSFGRLASLPISERARILLTLHPDGKRFAVLKTPGIEQAAAVNHVNFIFNFFDEIRSKVPPGK